LDDELTSSDKLPGFYVPKRRPRRLSTGAPPSLPSCDGTVESFPVAPPSEPDSDQVAESGADLEEPSSEDTISAADGVVEDFEEEEAEDDDEDGWITPQKLQQAKALTEPVEMDAEEMPAVVAMSLDFAVQNVLLQMGLHVISTAGLLIKEARSYALRCFGCFKISSRLDKQFCSCCGHKTLERVAVSVDSSGNKHYSILRRRPLSLKGTIFPLPRPRGGKYASNPVLIDGQRGAQHRPSAKAREHVDALSADFLARQSPFAFRDTTSRAAQLGFNSAVAMHGPKFYWERKNPNVVLRNSKK